MNIYQLVNLFKEVSISHKFVEEFNQGDIYEFLNNGKHRYGSANLTFGSISINNDLMAVSGTLFWSERLLEDRSNTLEVRNNGVKILNDILLKIQDDEPLLNFTGIQYQLFTEQFADLCAGAYASFTLTMPVESGCHADTFEAKTLDISHNGLYDVIGYTQVLVNVIVPTQIKSVTYEENGDYEMTPDTGKYLSKVSIKVNCDVVEDKDLNEVSSAWITAMVQRVINS